MGLNTIAGIALLSLVTQYGTETYGPQPAPVGEQIRYGNPNEEIRAAVQFLSHVPVHDQEFIKFFTTYSIPTNETIRIDIDSDNDLDEVSMRDAVGHYVLPFWIHSMSYGHVFRQPAQVTDTLYAIDIRDYGWTLEAFEKISQFDPYFRKPLVDTVSLDYLRLHSGNAILRADWFIAHTCDTTKQVDIDIEDPFYYELLYSSVEGGPPKNLKDFQKIWGVDIKTVQDLGILTGSIVDGNLSGVSRHNRRLVRARTLTGYYWESEDTKNMEQDRDYIENLVPDFLKAEQKDAGEAFTTNFLGLQVYQLADAEGNRVEFGDPTVVFDRSDPHDKRVRTARSCVICHPKGINVPSNSLRNLLDKGVELAFIDPLIGEENESFFLNHAWKRQIDEDINIFEDAVKNCVGIDAEVNATLFNKFNQWYDRGLDLEQAALEIGQDVELVKAKLTRSASGRLSDLVTGGEIPRSVWDNPKNVNYAQAMLLVYNISANALTLYGENFHNQSTIVLENHDNKTLVQKHEKPKLNKVNFQAKIKNNSQFFTNAYFQDQNNIDQIRAGTQVQVTHLTKDNKWALVVSNGIRGYVRANNVQRLVNKAVKPKQPVRAQPKVKSQTERLRDIRNRYFNSS